MTRDGIKICIRELQLNYANSFGKLDQMGMAGLLDIWELQFKNEGDVTVFGAVNSWISKSSYLPTIADIKKEIYGDDGYNEEEIWGIVLRAGRNGVYGAKKEWENLPEDIQSVITPRTLYDIAVSDDYSLQFIKRDLLDAYKKQYERRRNMRLSAGSRLDDAASVPQLLFTEKKEKK